MASKVSWPTIMCASCFCENGGRPCDICIHFNFKCKGTCPCCEESRKATPSTSKGKGASPSTSKGKGASPSTSKGKGASPSTSKGKGASPSTSKGKGASPSTSKGTSSSTTQVPEPVCTECDCLKTSIPCRKCVRGNLKCTGTCPCCAKSEEKTKITIDEKVLDNIIRNSVITPYKLSNNPVLLVPWDTFNTLSTASAQQSPAPKKIVFRKPPRLHPPEPPNKNLRSILCTQCFCEPDEIPCEICCFYDSYSCRGPCPCCTERSRQKILDPNAKNEYHRKCLSDLNTYPVIEFNEEVEKAVCPRCVCRPGEGLCHFCRKKAEENAAALARLKSKKRRREKPAILQHKKKLCNTSTDQAIYYVDQREVTRRKEMIKRLEYNLLNQHYLIEEYCLHCQCKRGSEPCLECRRTTCYGNCVCCLHNSKLLESEELLPDLPDPSANKDEQLEKFASLQDLIDDYLARMTGEVDHSSKPNRKCETCDCYKDFLACDNCSLNDLGCIFSGDVKHCLCCTLKLFLKMQGLENF